MTSKALWDGALGRGWSVWRAGTGACGLRTLGFGSMSLQGRTGQMQWGKGSSRSIATRAACAPGPRWVRDGSSLKQRLSGRESLVAKTIVVGMRDRYFSVQMRRLRESSPEKKDAEGSEIKNEALHKQQPSNPKPSVTSSSTARAIRKIIPPLSSLTPHENIYTLPNLLTASRLVAAPFVGYAILHDAHAWALGLFVYAGVTDLLDGWIARRWGLKTVVGSVIDPMADKMLMTVLTVCLAWQGGLPIWLAAIILGRDVGLAIAAIYYRWISLPPPKTMARYWDFSLPSAEVRPTTISKYNTFLQLALMGCTVVAPLLPPMGFDVGTGLTALQYIVATTTIWSGLSYVFSKDAVRILTKRK